MAGAWHGRCLGRRLGGGASSPGSAPPLSRGQTRPPRTWTVGASNYVVLSNEASRILGILEQHVLLVYSVPTLPTWRVPRAEGRPPAGQRRSLGWARRGWAGAAGGAEPGAAWLSRSYLHLGQDLTVLPCAEILARAKYS